MQIRAALLRGRAPAALGEHLGEQVAERRRVVRAAGREVEALEPRRLTARRDLDPMPGVVPRPAARIDQGLVRLQDLPESRLGRLVARIDIRVIPPRETAVRTLDLGVRRSVRHAEDDVQIHCATVLVVD